MTTDNQFTFLERRRSFEDKYYSQLNDDGVMKSISVVDVNTTELCNRTCVFCPRHDPAVFPNRNLHMTEDGAEIVAKKLQGIGYSGTIAISGFGENLLNPHIYKIIKKFREYNPSAFIECNTNGDPLKKSKALRLIEAGLDCLNVNLYDGPEQVEKFNEMLSFLPEEKYKLRAHWKEDDFGIIYNNRSGVIKWFKRDDHKDVQNNGCYYPFYKLFVDWNGDVLFCANDWGRTRVVGNLLQQPIEEVWMSKEMQKVRLSLAEGKRTIKPCNTCNVNGLLLGKQSFDIIMKHYDTSNG